MTISHHLTSLHSAYLIFRYLTLTKHKRLTLGEASSPPGREDQNKEEKLLSRAIALSVDPSLHCQAIGLSVENEEESDEEELLRQAIALSLED